MLHLQHFGKSLKRQKIKSNTSLLMISYIRKKKGGSLSLKHIHHLVVPFFFFFFFFRFRHTGFMSHNFFLLHSPLLMSLLKWRIQQSWYLLSKLPRQLLYSTAIHTIIILNKFKVKMKTQTNQQHRILFLPRLQWLLCALFPG